MKAYVLDSNAVIRYMLLWHDWERVKGLLHRARTGEAELAISVVNWGEVVYTLAKYIGLAKAIADVKTLGPAMETVGLQEEMAEVDVSGQAQ